MKRREATGSSAPPSSLKVFTASDWPGETPNDAFRHWRDARQAWADEHGWPGGEAAQTAGEIGVLVSLPDEPWNPYSEAP